MARREDIPKLSCKCLAYLFVEGVVVGAFVEVSGVVSDFGVQPVRTQAASPNSAIRVRNLFIVGVTLSKNEKRTSFF